MNKQQLELTHLMGKKELTFGCFVKFTEYTDSYTEGGIDEMGGPICEEYHRIGDSFMEEEGFSEKEILAFKNHQAGEYVQEIEIIGHKPTIAELHRWLNENGYEWTQSKSAFTIWNYSVLGKDYKYNSSKDLLDQSSETLAQIIELITNTK